jgi:hypothetical protein
LLPISTKLVFTNTLLSLLAQDRSRQHHQPKPEMKRARADTKASPNGKRARIDIPDYHLTESVLDENGDAIWPAPKIQMEQARALITEW